MTKDTFIQKLCECGVAPRRAKLIHSIMLATVRATLRPATTAQQVEPLMATVRPRVMRRVRYRAQMLAGR